MIEGVIKGGFMSTNIGRRADLGDTARRPARRLGALASAGWRLVHAARRFPERGAARRPSEVENGRIDARLNLCLAEIEQQSCDRRGQRTSPAKGSEGRL